MKQTPLRHGIFDNVIEGLENVCLQKPFSLLNIQSDLLGFYLRYPKSADDIRLHTRQLLEGMKSLT